jgi:hypothetical protein
MKRFINYIRVRFQRRAHFEIAVSDFIKILEHELQETRAVSIRPMEDLERHYGIK